MIRMEVRELNDHINNLVEVVKRLSKLWGIIKDDMELDDNWFIKVGNKKTGDIITLDGDKIVL